MVQGALCSQDRAAGFAGLQGMVALLLHKSPPQQEGMGAASGITRTSDGQMPRQPKVALLKSADTAELDGQAPDSSTH